MPRPKLARPRSKHDFVLRLDDPAQSYANDQIEAMKLAGTFQDWIRSLVVKALQRPAKHDDKTSPVVKPNGHRVSTTAQDDLDYVPAVDEA
jgi:hypothetical protein